MVSGASLAAPAGGSLYMLGGLGPLVAAVWLLRRSGRSYRRDVVRRVSDPRRIRLRWWCALAAVSAGPAVIGAVAAWLAGADATVPPYGLGAVGGVLAVALLAGAAEEPGWRGVASDAWQRHALPAWAGLGIGAAWALWHLPLAFIDGTYYSGLGFGSVAYWLTILALVQLGVLYLWLANGSGGSILVAILAHAGFNVAASLASRRRSRSAERHDGLADAPVGVANVQPADLPVDAVGGARDDRHHRRHEAALGRVEVVDPEVAARRRRLRIWYA